MSLPAWSLENERTGLLPSSAVAAECSSSTTSGLARSNINWRLVFVASTLLLFLLVERTTSKVKLWEVSSSPSSGTNSWNEGEHSMLEADLLQGKNKHKKDKGKDDGDDSKKASSDEKDDKKDKHGNDDENSASKQKDHSKKKKKSDKDSTLAPTMAPTTEKEHKEKDHGKKGKHGDGDDGKKSDEDKKNNDKDDTDDESKKKDKDGDGKKKKKKKHDSDGDSKKKDDKEKKHSDDKDDKDKGNNENKGNDDDGKKKDKKKKHNDDTDNQKDGNDDKPKKKDKKHNDDSMALRPLKYFNTSDAYQFLNNDFYLWLQGWDAQAQPAYSSVASVAALLNSLRGHLELPTDPSYSPYPYATQTNVLEGLSCVHDTVVRYTSSTENGILRPPGGLNMRQTEALLNCHMDDSWNIESSYVDPASMTLDQLRADLVQAIAIPTSSGILTRVLVYYDGTEVGLFGRRGRWSPAVAYSPDWDAVLILDVAKYENPPFWVTLDELYNSMATMDLCGNWDSPRGQDMLTFDQMHPQTIADYTAATQGVLNCQATHRGFLVVSKHE